MGVDKGPFFLLRSIPPRTASVSWRYLCRFMAAPSWSMPRFQSRLPGLTSSRLTSGRRPRKHARQAVFFHAYDGSLALRLYNPSPMETGLKNRVAIVAASSQGIGRAAAEALASEGCRVAMCAPNPQPLEAAAEQIRKQYGAEVFAQPLDV